MNHLLCLPARLFWALLVLWAIALPTAAFSQEMQGPQRLQTGVAITAQQSEKAQTALIERLGDRAEKRDRILLMVCGVLFFVGAFCGHWAQNNYRNPVVWFFAGFVFSVGALGAIVWMHFHSRHRRRNRRVMAYWHF